ncbi:MAG: ATP-binding protein [Ilumatobacteraceae bacterium]
MKNPLSGIRGRVTFTVLAVTAVLYSALAAVGFVQIANSGRDAIRERINVVLDDLELAVRSGSGTLNLSTPDGVTAQVFDATASILPNAPEGTIRVERVIDVNGRPIGLVGFSSEARLTDSLRSLYRGLWIGIPLAAIVSALMAGLATRRALRPVGAITELASTIGATPDGDRVPVPDTGDEIERLATTVNQMLDRIEAGRAAQRQFTSDAAHELRTPLMALQGELELVAIHDAPVDAPLIERMQSLCGRLGERIDDLLLLSTLDEDRPLTLTTESLLAVVRDEAAALAPDAVIEGADTTLSFDRDLVARAARNLLANAQRHATTQVRATVEVVDGRCWLHVDDDGPGVAPEATADMFRRFARLDEARSVQRGGAGLGLAIVASVAEAHHGGVRASAAPLGGARVSMWLPVGEPTVAAD